MTHRAPTAIAACFAALFMMIGGCGNSGGGGGGTFTVGGAPNTPCAPATQGQGCNGTEKVTCDPGSSTWKSLGFCGTGQYCLGKLDPNDPQQIKQVVHCQSSGGGQTDTVAGQTDTGTGQSDAGTVVSDGQTATDTGTTTQPDVVTNTCGNGACDAGEQTTCPKDCESNPCGDGTCAPGETPNTCPEDCKTTSNNCGNLKCDDGETKTSCPYDCSPFAAEISACAQSKCAADAAACSAQPACVAAVGAA
ncbi:MAG: hypothetical protein KC502_23910, partial [Myxococcales bacterium]|nr:hypothetical protein [Myxococcales bacterium]